MGKTRSRIQLGDANRKPERVKPPVSLAENLRPLVEFKKWGQVQVKAIAPCGPAKSGYKCVASWKVLNSNEDEQAFLDAWEAIGLDPTRLFHGTKATNVASITQQGLVAGRRGCMFGSGIYFGKINKALMYSNGSGDAHYVFEADVLLGKSKVADAPHPWNLKALRKEGYDSIHGKLGRTVSRGGTLRNDEWVVYSRDQILLDKLHEYQYLSGEFWVPPPIKGSCGLITTKDVYLGKSARAFRDVIERQMCGNEGYTQLILEGNKRVWACNSCIQKGKLRVGSKVTVRMSGNGWREPEKQFRVIGQE